MDFVELNQNLNTSASSNGSGNVWEHLLLEKLATFSLVVKGLQELDHPLMRLLSSEQFHTKTAAKGKAALTMLKGLKEADQAKPAFNSILLSLISAPFRKHSPKLDQAVLKAQKSLLKADEVVGRGMSKVPIVGGLFKKKQIYKTPGKAVKQGPKGLETGTYVAESTTSLAEPLAKAQTIVTPVLATIGAISVANAVSRRKKMVNEQQQLMKQAAAAIDQLNEQNKALEQEKAGLIEKLAHFERQSLAAGIANDLAEKGMIDDETVQEFAEKLASDEGRDLNSLKTAMDQVHGLREIGTLYSEGTGVGESVDPLTDWLMDFV